MIGKDLIVALKGFGMGAANVIPGVSGGTIALLTGIFGQLVDSLNAFASIETWKKLFKGEIREFWSAIGGRFLVALFIGVLASVFTLAKLMEYVLHYYPVHTWGFFFGMILASAVVMLLDVKKWKGSDVLWALVGVALGIGVCMLSPTETPSDLWFIFLCGAIAICTMILPGVSGSFILLILGKYDYIMGAVSSLNIPVLIVFALGCGIGLLAFSKLLHLLLEKCEKQTMLVLVGFVIGSLVKVWPWSNPQAILEANALTGAPAGELHVNAAIVWGIAGVFLVWVLEMLSGKKMQ